MTNALRPLMFPGQVWNLNMLRRNPVQLGSWTLTNMFVILKCQLKQITQMRRSKAVERGKFSPKRLFKTTALILCSGHADGWQRGYKARRNWCWYTACSLRGRNSREMNWSDHCLSPCLFWFLKKVWKCFQNSLDFEGQADFPQQSPASLQRGASHQKVDVALMILGKGQ